jgi:hypothetical protein
MASKDEIESFTIRPPRRGEGYALAGSATTQVFAAPTSWKGKKVRFRAVGDVFYVMTAPANDIVILPAQRQTISSFALTGPNTGTGEPIYDGQYAEFDFTDADTYVGFIGTGTNGVLWVRETETALGSGNT